MNINDKILNRRDRAIFSLRSLYGRYGYSQYKMSKFEEYDLYVRNKDFLVSDNIITFNDINGKLMALKPDVTLSIIKSCKEEPGAVEKLYYNENVYRVSKGDKSFREILQVGLECVGDIDDYCVSEVIMLAAKSLKSISNECVLDISHLGILSAAIKEAGIPDSAVREIINHVGEKNIHEIKSICRKAGVAEDKCDKLCALVSTYGKPADVINKLSDIFESEEIKAYIEELSSICDALKTAGVSDIIRIDFSVVNDVKYYNGIAFKGFINGVPNGILSGGRYDNLMKRMGRKSGAIGFAVYLDMLASYEEAEDEFDVDMLILYEEGEKLSDIRRVADMLSENGASVMVQRAAPEKIKYRRLAKVRNGEVTILEDNA